MISRAKHWFTQLLSPLLAACALCATLGTPAVAQEILAFTQQELDQMLAPIALYPDALLSQILMASTYPLEVIEAERWSVANSRLSGRQAVQAVERNYWDPSVKSLVAFPQILRMMSTKLDWTERLGDAFLGQEQQVMETVQDLRQRAYRAGNLVSNDQARVEYQRDIIIIEPANIEIAYEPYYNPTIVYGSWWWPEYPPVYWSAWPGYRVRAGYGNGFAWGVGIFLGPEFFYGGFDWRQRHVNIINVNNYYFPHDPRFGVRTPRPWQHDAGHRRGIPYRAVAVRERFSPPGSPRQPRSDFRGYLPPPTGPRIAPVNQSGTHTDGRTDGRTTPRPDGRTLPGAGTHADTRPDTRTDNRPPRTGGLDNRGNGRPDGASSPAAPNANSDNARLRQIDRINRQNAMPPPVVRPNTPTTPATPPTVLPPPRQPHVLENVGQPGDARNASMRGHASRDANPPADRLPPPAPRPAAPPPQARPPQASAPVHTTPPAPAPPRAQDKPRDKGRDEK